MKKHLAGALVVLGLTVLVPASAMGASTTATGTLAAGQLTIAPGAAPTFNGTLDGTDQNLPYTLPTTVTDARGGQLGWQLTLSGTQFSTGGGTPSTLPANASTMTGVTSTCVAGSTCTAPTNSVSYPLGLPAASTTKYFNAATGTGKGKFTNTPTISVAVPANSDAGTYTSTLTLSAVSGP